MPGRSVKTMTMAVVVAWSVILGSSAPSSAQATPTPAAPRVSTIVVHSHAMDRDIDLTIVTPADASRPRGVLYLMNGAAGGENRANWVHQTDLVQFLATKNVYVVIPTQGAYTFYTDWLRPDARLGLNKWSTFLGTELPPVIDTMYRTSGRNAVAGISGSATSALNLVIEHPGRFRAAASFSGCAATSDRFGQLAVRSVVEFRGQSNATNMWGPYGSQGWLAHDPVLHAARLRGTALYISSATGQPGRYDNLQQVPDPMRLADQLAVGGAIEAATLHCTQQLRERLHRLNIPAMFDFAGPGTHAWPYFQEVFHRAWPFFARALGG